MIGMARAKVKNPSVTSEEGPALWYKHRTFLLDRKTNLPFFTSKYRLTPMNDTFTFSGHGQGILVHKYFSSCWDKSESNVNAVSSFCSKEAQAEPRRKATLVHDISIWLLIWLLDLWSLNLAPPRDPSTLSETSHYPPCRSSWNQLGTRYNMITAYEALSVLARTKG